MKDGDNMFGKNLRQLRESKGLKQNEFAKVLGVERSRYNKWEQEVSEPNYKVLCQIADYFHVTTDYLLGREKQ